MEAGLLSLSPFDGVLGRGGKPYFVLFVIPFDLKKGSQALVPS